MHVAREDIPVVLAVPGATARQIGGFGSIAGAGEIAGEAAPPPVVPAAPLSVPRKKPRSRKE